MFYKQKIYEFFNIRAADFDEEDRLVNDVVIPIPQVNPIYDTIKSVQTRILRANSGG